MQGIIGILLVLSWYNVHGVARVGNNVWVCVKDTGGANVYYSPDAGYTWEERGAMYSGFYPELWDIEFANENTGWAVGWAGLIFGTADGGKTWVLELPGGPKHFGRVKFVDNFVGWTSGGDAFYGKTTDGGVNWSWYSTVPGIVTDLYGVAAFDSLEAWMVGGVPAGMPGGQGFIIHTVDGGSTWELVDSSSVYEYLDVYFANPSKGWVVGGLDTIPYTPILLYTDDGGNTFMDRTPQNTYTLRAVQFIDENEGWAVGKYGTIIHTTDGGQTWENQPSGVTVTLFDIEFINSDVGTVVGDSGIILFTEDGGNTWHLRSPFVGVKERSGASQRNRVRLLSDSRSLGFEVRDVDGDLKAVLYDVTGRKTGHVLLRKGITWITGLEPGVYFVRVPGLGTFKGLVLP